MDHLPRPSRANRRADDPRHPETRLLGNLHDGHLRAAFEEYPLRRGFSRTELSSGEFPQARSQRAAVVVQNWLFFGLLEEAFRDSVPATDFIVATDDGDEFLSTRLLGDYVGRWRARVQASSREESAKWAARLREVYLEAARFFLLYHASGAHSQYPDGFATYLNPLALLLETLQHYVSDIFADGAEHEPLPANCSPQATQELVERGWCPFTVANILLSSSSPALFEYARLFRDHPPFIYQDHGQCTTRNCAVANVDTSTYETKHCSLYCKGKDNCEILKADMDILKVKLEAGKIPVTLFTEHQGLVTLGSEDGPYIAISHVWADGMGSTSEKGLPVCVVKFLSEAATTAFNSLHNAELDTVPFWIDSLCIPSRANLRGKAIGLMAKTYASAAAVVVIDATIRNISVSDPVQEQLFVLYVSTWVQRLWTLQEALLSRQLFFRISDGLIDARYFFTDDVIAFRFKDPVATKLLGWLGQMMVIPAARNAQAAGLSQLSIPQPSLDDVALHLAKRTSSRQSDETLAIAGLFDQDASAYISLSPDQRMAKFLAEHNNGKVPYDILFLDGPKLPIENFTWAPKSFMKRLMNLELKGTWERSMSVVTTHGLLGQYFCLSLEDEWSVDEPPRNHRLRINDGRHLVILFDRSIDPDEESVPDYNVLILPRSINEGEEFLAAGTQSLGHIQVGEDAETVEQVELTCYVHVFNEDKCEGWNNLPVASSATGATRFVLIS